MKFYTNVQLIGNQFLVRGVENGRRYEHRDEFFPTLFVKSKKKTKYKTLNGEAVEAINPGTVRDCREFYKKMTTLRGSTYMALTGTYINIFQRNTQRMKSSLTYLKLSLLLWILKLRLSKASLMWNRASKRFWQSQYKTIQLSRSLLGEANPLRILGMM